ncbi:DUF2336 domain-containing protein [uncultured Cohaesibacter sp.]|uniref:DUF2336 domain-containing protein n=1 Tax=uncultured Cohaesibacter sp. TaxID=1002546 RepID=UPI00293125CE|nr:DUF2336 domain-containing protein [uncultured Cohaesibacter sp.]
MADGIVQQLQHLARENDPEARSLLIRKITAEYARRTGLAPSETERELFSALVLDLYSQIDLSARRDIITLLARTRHISTILAERLANEHDDLVASLFEFSPMLGDKLLLHSARVRSEAVLRAIARREKVPEDLVDALMSRAYNSVVSELLKNLGSDFSANALLLCSIICQTSFEIQSLMAARCLSDQAFHGRMKSRAEQGCPFMPEELAKAAREGRLPEWVEKYESQTLVDDGETASLSREEFLVKINLGEITFDQLLQALIRKKRKEDIIWLLKDAPGLSPRAMQHLLTSPANRILFRLLVEKEVSVKTFTALTQWRAQSLGFPDRHVNREIEAYRQLMHQKVRAQRSSL